MSLREMQFHKTNPKLATVYQTIFDDLIVGHENVDNVKTEMYSYETYVKNTILTVFILRAEITSLDDASRIAAGDTVVPEVEVLSFCYPRELEQKIIDVSINKNYETVFKVPNGIKDLATVEIRNLRLQSPGFAELFQEYFSNEHYHILNRYTFYGDPKEVFAEPEPLTPEQEAEAKAYDNFCLHDLPKFEKAKKSLITELGKTLERAPLKYGRFKLKRKEHTDVTLACGATPVFDANDYEQRKVDHDLYFTMVGDKVTDVNDIYTFIEPALIRVPHYMAEGESRVIEPLRFSDLLVPDGLIEDESEDAQSKMVDLDLYPTIWEIERMFEHADTLVKAFILKWGYHPDLVERIKDTLNAFLYMASNKRDVLYTFNDTTILEAHLNRVLQRIDDLKAEQDKPNAEWYLDADSWKLWDYADPTKPTEVPGWELGKELADFYSESYVDFFSGYVRSVPHHYLRPYSVITPVPEDQIGDHAIGSVRQE